MRLTVKPLKKRDPGDGMAVIDRQALGEAGLSGGDFVAIEGRDGRVVARAWPSDSPDAGRGIVRIDGQLRQTAGVSVDDPLPVSDFSDRGACTTTAVHHPPRQTGGPVRQTEAGYGLARPASRVVGAVERSRTSS